MTVTAVPGFTPSRVACEVGDEGESEDAKMRVGGWWRVFAAPYGVGS